MFKYKLGKWVLSTDNPRPYDKKDHNSFIFFSDLFYMFFYYQYFSLDHIQPQFRDFLARPSVPSIGIQLNCRWSSFTTKINTLSNERNALDFSIISFCSVDFYYLSILKFDAQFFLCLNLCICAIFSRNERKFFIRIWENTYILL